MSKTATLVASQPSQSNQQGFDIVELQTRGQDAESSRIQVQVYSRFSKSQKRSITALLAFCGLLATISTTSILAAVPEIVDEYQTTTSIINISNSVYLVFMGISSCIWGPCADNFGRRKAGNLVEVRRHDC